MSNQDTPWTIEISLVLPLEVRYICTVIDGDGLESFNVTINVNWPWKTRLESVSAVHRGIERKGHDDIPGKSAFQDYVP